MEGADHGLEGGEARAQKTGGAGGGRARQVEAAHAYSRDRCSWTVAVELVTLPTPRMSMMQTRHPTVLVGGASVSRLHGCGGAAHGSGRQVR